MTDQARLALGTLLACAVALQLARAFERSAAQEPAPRPVTVAAPTPELHKLRDGQPLDLNAATSAELEALPGVGPALAARIVQARTSRNGFKQADELRSVSGVGPKTWQRLAPLVSVGARAP